MDQLLNKLDSRIQTAVNEVLDVRQAAVSSPTVPAAPPPHLEDVEQAVQASMLVSGFVDLRSMLSGSREEVYAIDRSDRRGTITTASVTEEVFSSHTTRLDKGME